MTNQDKKATILGFEKMLESILLKLQAPSEDCVSVRSIFRAFLDDSQKFPWTMDRFMFTVGERIGQSRWYKSLNGHEREKFLTSLRELAEAANPGPNEIIDKILAEDRQGDEEKDESDQFPSREFTDGFMRTKGITIELIGRSFREKDDGSPLTSEERADAEEFFESNVADVCINP